MENCTIIKVKRKINEDPVDCLILECKKKKLIDLGSVDSTNGGLLTSGSAASDAGVVESIKEILKYAGSASNEDEVSARLIEINSKTKDSLPKIAAKQPILKHSNSAKGGKKDVAKPQAAKENEPVAVPAKTLKYVLTNKKRGYENSISMSMDQSKDDSVPSGPADATIEEADAVAASKAAETRKKSRKNSILLDNFNIIDVVASDYFCQDDQEPEPESQKPAAEGEQITCNNVVLIREKVTTTAKKDVPKGPVLDAASNEYVYDIYYTKNSNINLDLLYANNYEITPMVNKNQLIILDENQDDDDGENYEDDEDSNDEANWRNDYPDEDDNDSYDDNDDHDDNEDDYGDDYNEYGRGYYDEEGDGKLSSYLKKSCALDRSYYDEDGDSDEYDEKDTAAPISYTAYKKRTLRELEHDYQNIQN